jgi:hypothetical protein
MTDFWNKIYEKETDTKDYLKSLFTEFDNMKKDVKHPLNKIVINIDKKSWKEIFNEYLFWIKKVDKTSNESELIFKDFLRYLYNIFWNVEDSMKNFFSENIGRVNMRLFWYHFDYHITLEKWKISIKRAISGSSFIEVINNIDLKKYGEWYRKDEYWLSVDIQKIIYKDIYINLKEFWIRDEDYKLFLLLQKIIGSVHSSYWSRYMFGRNQCSWNEKKMMNFINLTQWENQNILPYKILNHPLFFKDRSENDLLDYWTYDVYERKLWLKKEENPGAFYCYDSWMRDFISDKDILDWKLVWKNFTDLNLKIYLSRCFSEQYKEKSNSDIEEDIWNILKLALIYPYKKALIESDNIFEETKLFLKYLKERNFDENYQVSFWLKNTKIIYFNNFFWKSFKKISLNDIYWIVFYLRYLLKNKQLIKNWKDLDSLGMKRVNIEYCQYFSKNDYWDIAFKKAIEYINKEIETEFGTIDLDKIKTIIKDIQKVDLKNYIWTNISEKDYFILRDLQSKIVKLKKYEVIENGNLVNLYLESWETVQIKGNWKPIEFSSNYNITPKIINWGMSFEGSFKLWFLNLYKDEIKIQFWNEDFFINTLSFIV